MVKTVSRVRLARIYRASLEGRPTFCNAVQGLELAFASESHKRQEVKWLEQMEKTARESGWLSAVRASEQRSY